jgi:hypothetical protein
MVSWVLYTRDVSLDSLWICLLLGYRHPGIKNAWPLVIKFGSCDALAALLHVVYQTHIDPRVACLLYVASLIASAALAFARPRYIIFIPLLCCTDSFVSDVSLDESIVIGAVSSATAAWCGVQVGKWFRWYAPELTKDPKMWRFLSARNWL